MKVGVAYAIMIVVHDRDCPNKYPLILHTIHNLKACSHYESNAHWKRINSHCLRSH